MTGTPSAAPTFWTKLAYGFGAAANGVADNAFNYFLLMFYGQVIGLSPILVGLAMTIGMMVDACLDPIIGLWSDNLRSPWGRRHPFIYAAVVPTGLLFFLIWNPPIGWSEQALFLYLLGLSVLIRAAGSLFQIPSSALAPELSTSYDQRSSLMSYRYFFGWVVGNAMTVSMFYLIFPAFSTAAVPNGQFNRDAYAFYGVLVSILAPFAMLVSGLGTHRHIPNLTVPPLRESKSIKELFAEIFATLGNRSFAALFIAATFGAVSTGLAAGLAFYFSTYFWRFTTLQNAYLTMGVFASAVLGFLAAPWATRTIGKKQAAVIIGLIAFLGSPLPIVLRLLGLMPANGTPETFWIVFGFTAIDTGLIICFQILASSMMADLVEQAQVRTGKRSEGLFFAADGFARKMVTGLGLILATLLLQFANFPKGADPSQVSDAVTARLAILYVPSILFLWLSMVAVISTYKVSRSDHEKALQDLSDKAVKPALTTTD